jgi:hypothetical protein
MKTLTSALLIIAVFFISSFKKDKNDDIIKSNLSLNVNGTAKRATGNKSVFAMHYSSDKSLQIVGNFENNEAITISIENYNGTGKYKVANKEVLAAYVADLNGSMSGSRIAKTGTVSINAASDTALNGAFEFEVIDPATGLVTSVIAEGKFAAKLTSL